MAASQFHSLGRVLESALIALVLLGKTAFLLSLLGLLGGVVG